MTKPLKNTLRLAIFLFLAIALAAGFVPALAFESRPNGLIPAGEVINDDVSISAETVVVEGTVNGALFISSAKATIKGVINGDLLINSAEAEIEGQVNGNLALFGQTFKLNAPVSGSVFAACASLQMLPSAQIGRNLFFMGFGLETDKGAVIGRDISASGYQASLSGEVKRKVSFGGSAFELDGIVGGDILASVNKPGQTWETISEIFKFLPIPIVSGIRVSSEAIIGGKLTYISPVAQDEAIHAVPAGGIEHQLPEKRHVQEQSIAANRFKNRFQELVVLILLGGLSTWLIPKILHEVSDKVKQPLPALGWGLATFFGGLIALGIFVVAVFISGILFGVVNLGGVSSLIFSLGMPIAGLSFGLFILIAMHGSILVIANWVGKWVVGKFLPTYQGHAFWPLLVGIIIYVVLSLPPCLGDLIAILAALVGMGAIWIAFRIWKTNRARPVL